MKELISSFKLIYQNDRRVLIMMGVVLLAGIVLFLLPILNLNPGVSRTWVRYSDIDGGYAEGSWWYLLSFSVLGLLLSVGHCLLAVKLYSKRGVGVAMLFLGLSLAEIAIAIAYLLKIFGRG